MLLVSEGPLALALHVSYLLDSGESYGPTAQHIRKIVRFSLLAQLISCAITSHSVSVSRWHCWRRRHCSRGKQVNMLT